MIGEDNVTCVPAITVARVRFVGAQRRFAVVDVVAHPQVAEELTIDTSGTSKQLPTVALFVGGRCGAHMVPC